MTSRSPPISQNGYTTGKLTGISISSTGVVQAQYTNGNSANLGQIAIANFANPQGLQQLGNQTWAQTFGSGAAVRVKRAARAWARSSPARSRSPTSTPRRALVDMITAQRDFQANAQMLQTDDQITQTIININGQA